MSTFESQIHKKFNETYQRLNEEQKKAVDTIDGPVMVIAGPGTGKTQILACRIAKILLTTDTQAENILCLTYTDAGVVAMRKRLVQFIGAEAYKVKISTFHAFCNDVIQDNLSLFDKTSMDPVSELEKIELYKKLIDSLPKDNVLKRYRGDIYFDIYNLQTLFTTMKREGWTATFISAKIDDYIKDLPNREEYIYKTSRTGQFKKGEVKQTVLNREVQRKEKLRAAANEFDNFQQLMQQHNRYDFDDMINWVLQAFEKDEALLLDYQEKFQYILVDEYQDTSGTQNNLIDVLISYWDNPNIFVVGDDDQSIYRFQGANIENMQRFANNFQKSLYTVVLTQNYRSIQPILDVSKKLIDRNNERLINIIPGLSKTLIAANTAHVQPYKMPEIIEYESPRHEMVGITLQCEALLQQGVEPGKMAVIYKENRYGEELAHFFNVRNIAYYNKKSIDVFTLPFTQKIIQFLSYLTIEHDIPFSGDEVLFEILHFDWFDIPPVEIAKITNEVSESRFKGNHTSIRQTIAEKAAQPAVDLFTPSVHEGIKRASQIIEKIIGSVHNLTLQQLVESIVQRSGILSIIMKSTEKHWLLQVLSVFFDFLRDETRRNTFLSLKQFVSTIDLMQKEHVRLPLVQINGNDKGVNLLTVHGSKGLEFDYVFFVGCDAPAWEQKRKPYVGYEFPDNMFLSIATDNDIEELRRLFYVALTRAAGHLYISYSQAKSNGKLQEPSRFIAELNEGDSIPFEKKIISGDVIDTFAIQRMFKPIAPEIAALETDFVNRLLEKFVMNATALNTYLKCPLEFYYKNLLRIPFSKNEALAFGSSVHYALEKYFRKMQDDPDKNFPTEAEFVGDFDWHLRRHREYFTAEQFARRKEYGEIILSKYYRHYDGKHNKIVSVERNFSNVLVDGIPIKGKVDKIEFDGNKNANVVDYKTGDVKFAFRKLKSPDEKQPKGGDYWRQAVFYKLLIDGYQGNDWKVVSAEFDFIEPVEEDNYVRKKVVITPQDITTVKQQIKDTWQSIQDHDFYIGCGDPKCHWCNFVKNNNIAVALHDLTDTEE